MGIHEDTQNLHGEVGYQAGEWDTQAAPLSSVECRGSGCGIL